MDKTHLRFFTFKTARRMAEEANLSVTRMGYTPYLVRALLPLVKGMRGEKIAEPDSLLKSRAYRAYLKFIYPVEHAVAGICRSLFAFRIILVVQPRG